MASAKNKERIIVDGCAFPPDWNPLEIQLWLFRYSPQLQLDPFWRPQGKRSDRAYTGTGRFSHCRKVITALMPTFEWHEWSEQQVRALCEHSQVGFCGGGGCVLGSTRLWNPITNENPTIEELCHSNIRPTVMTLHGPMLADVPYIKGCAPMFEIALTNGARFTVTQEHRVLTRSGYVQVRELSVGDLLFGFSRDPLDSTSDNALLIHAQDAHRCSEKAQDSRIGCRPFSRSCDGQPPNEKGDAQQSPPSQIGVQEHGRVLESKSSRSHLSLASDLRAMRDFSALDSRSHTPSQSHCAQETDEPADRSFQQRDLLRSAKRHLRPFPERLHVFGHMPSCATDEESRVYQATSLSPDHPREAQAQFGERESAAPASRGQQQRQGSIFSSARQCTVWETSVESMRYVGEEVYYDIGVPVAHHYFAEGAIHHNSGKSASTGAYALVFAMSGLNYKSESEGGDTGVLIASTTIDAAIRRIWKSVAQFYGDMMRASGGGVGKQALFGKPRPQIRAAPRDLMHGIFVIPVATGDIQKAINDLKGFHPKRLLLIGDETDSISQAVVEVQDNLRVGTEEFQCVWLGNLPSIFNPLGKLMEPAPNTAVSEECGLQWTSTSGVHCLRFDGEQSPNITGEEKWSGLPRQRDIDATLRRNMGVKGQQYYIMVKGLPPPEGVDDTVLSESTLNRFHVRDGVTWAGQFIASAALDPGFGGDPCCLKLFRRGNDTSGKLRCAVVETLAIPINATDTATPAEFQIAKRVMEICKAHSIAPDEFVLDSTGIGRGTAAVLQREWSPNILLCNFGGAASDRPVSNEDHRPSNEAYDRQVTELWFSIREFIHSDILRNLDLDTARQLTQRRFEVKNRKFAIEKKEDMKARGIPSPNDADALACYIHLLRNKGIHAAPEGPATLAASEEWEQTAAQWSMEGAAADYSVFG